MENVYKKVLKQIRKEINIDDIEIYLRPKSDEFGSSAAASKVARVSDGAIEEIEDYVTEGNYIVSRAWMEVMAIINGAFNEDGEFVSFEDEDEDYIAREECIHIPIGQVRGYMIDKEELALDLECNGNGAFKFDDISQILSDLWAEIAWGNLRCVVEEYDDYIMDESKYCIYYLDEILYKEGFASNKIDKAVVKLLPSAIEDYLNKEVEEILYEPYRSELDVCFFFNQESLTEEFYENRNEVFKKEGFRYLEGKYGNVYYCKSDNLYLEDYYSEECNIDIDNELAISLANESNVVELEKQKEEKQIIHKDIKNLNFKVRITDYEKPLDDDGYEYEFYDVNLKDNMKLSTKDANNLVKYLKNYIDDESMILNRIEVYDGEVHIGTVTYYMLEKVKSIFEFISKSEAQSGDAGVCACTIVNQGLFSDMVQNRRYAYIEWINLNKEYKTLENEGIVLEKIIKYLKLNYKVKRIFARPVPIDLTDSETKCMRVDYYQVERNFYLQYGNYMVGYVKSYYNDAPANIEYLDSLSAEEYSEIFKSYDIKQSKMQDVYKSKGMKILGDKFVSVMYLEN